MNIKNLDNYRLIVNSGFVPIVEFEINENKSNDRGQLTKRKNSMLTILSII